MAEQRETEEMKEQETIKREVIISEGNEYAKLFYEDGELDYIIINVGESYGNKLHVGRKAFSRVCAVVSRAHQIVGDA